MRGSTFRIIKIDYGSVELILTCMFAFE